MVHAIRIHEHGGPEVLRWEAVELPPPGPGEARVRQTAVGLNFVDCYHRSGLYPLPALPSGLGSEAAGVVEAVGDGVTAVRVGDRVAYATGVPQGAYAEARNLPAAALVRVPDGVTDEQAAALLLKGLTAHYLLFETYAVEPGDTVLLHAAAGGVGLFFCQWARALGVTVIGTVSSEPKAAIARAHGCTHVLVHGQDDVVARVRELTGGRGVPVVYDSIGKDTWDASLDCLAPLGLMVSFGNASGPPPPLDLRVLAAKGSLYVTRPTLRTYAATRAQLEHGADMVFRAALRGDLQVTIAHRYPLRDAAVAQRALEARQTTGQVVLTVDS